MRRRPVRKDLSPITLFYLSLLFWEIVQGIAWIINIEWIQRGRVVMGESCVAQGMSYISFSTYSTRYDIHISLIFSDPQTT
jgi:hypothetical protein